MNNFLNIFLVAFEKWLREIIRSEIKNAMPPAQQPAPKIKFISRTEACELMGISYATALSWAKASPTPFGPTCYRVGALCKYREDEILDFIQSGQIKGVKTERSK